MPIIVLTGVENAGKTTLTKMLSEELTWPWIPEFARTDARVVNQATEHQDLQRLHDAFRRSLDENRYNGTDHLLCDTGALVLDMWSRTVFHRPLHGAEETMRNADLHLLCHTLNEWEPDPLRTLPRLSDRIALQDEYRQRLIETGVRYAEISSTTPSDRMTEALQHIRTLLP